MSARRFVWRWNRRVLRREWRDHLMIFVLVLAGVTISVGGALAAYNLVEPPQSEFGNGQFGVNTSQPEALQQSLREQGHAFGLIESVTLTRYGSTERIHGRRIDPDNRITGPLISLLAGQWPDADDEIAITDRALLDEAMLDSTVELSGQTVRVVGLVENPTALSDEFALAGNLEQLAGDGASITTEFLIDADQAEVEFSAVSDFGVTSTDGPQARTALTMVVNVVGAFGMLEIAMLVGSAFAVIARRRHRQFGLLAAAGATPRLIRTAATTTGTILGLFAAVLGMAIGVSLTGLVVPAMESTVGHRIDFAVPLWAVLPNVVVAVSMASLAARWPSRALSELPVVNLLAASRPRPEPVGRAATAGIVFTVAGGAALVAGFTNLNIMLALLGTLIAPVGLLLVSPLLVRLLGRVAARFPLSERLAGRAIARYNRRSATVVAALALALAVPVGLAVVTSSIDRRAETAGPNLAENWIILWTPGADDHLPRLPANPDPDAPRAIREALGAVAPDLDLVALEMAIPKDSLTETWEFSALGEIPAVAPVVAARQIDAECTFCDVDAYGFGEDDENGTEIDYKVEPSWVASPPLLETLGLDTAWLGTPSLAMVEDGRLLAASSEGILAGHDQVVVSGEWPRNTTIPSVLLSPNLVDEDDYNIATVGWLGVSDGPIAEEMQEVIRRSSGTAVVEFHQPPQPKSRLRIAGLSIGLALGLGIAVSAVGLLATELTDDIALLASIGASPRVGQRLSAAIAAMLATIGALLAVFIGYLPLLPMVTSRADNFPFVIPWPTLAGLLVVFPILAAAVGWLMNRTAAQGVAMRNSV